MKVWAWIAGILAGIGLIVLMGWGDGGRTVAGRDREAFAERSAQVLVPAPAAVGTDVTLNVVVADSATPSEVKTSLEQVQGLLATAASQSGDQKKATLQQADDTLKIAIDATKDAAKNTSNDVTKLHLLVLAQLQEQISNVIQIQIEPL
jgi:hypothetical protein